MRGQTERQWELPASPPHREYGETQVDRARRSLWLYNGQSSRLTSTGRDSKVLSRIRGKLSRRVEVIVKAIVIPEGPEGIS